MYKLMKKDKVKIAFRTLKDNCRSRSYHPTHGFYCCYGNNFNADGYVDCLKHICPLWKRLGGK